MNPSLSVAIEHAERFAACVASAEREIERSPWRCVESPSEAELWIRGRGAEVRAFVADIVNDCRSHVLSQGDGEAIVREYTRRLHVGFHEHLGHEAGCCPDLTPPQRTISRPRTEPLACSPTPVSP